MSAARKNLLIGREKRGDPQQHITNAMDALDLGDIEAQFAEHAAAASTLSST